jgi:hypothetical protein
MRRDGPAQNPRIPKGKAAVPLGIDGSIPDGARTLQVSRVVATDATGSRLSNANELFHFQKSVNDEFALVEKIFGERFVVRANQPRPPAQPEDPQWLILMTMT